MSINGLVHDTFDYSDQQNKTENKFLKRNGILLEENKFWQITRCSTLINMNYNDEVT